MVECCGKKVTVKKVRTSRPRFLVPEFPIWRGRCTSCDEWYCRQGHRTSKGWPREYVGVGFACTQDECGEFYETWFRLWRGTVPLANGRVTPEVSAEKADALMAWARESGGPRGEATVDFLDRWGPRKSNVSFSELASRRRNGVV